MHIHTRTQKDSFQAALKKVYYTPQLMALHVENGDPTAVSSKPTHERTQVAKPVLSQGFQLPTALGLRKLCSKFYSIICNAPMLLTTLIKLQRIIHCAHNYYVHS